MLTDKVLFITGGTSGIGKATVLEALKQGAKVCFAGRNQQEADTLIQQAHEQGFDTMNNLLFASCDVTDEQQIISALAMTISKRGKLDGVFANAGYHTVGNILETSLEERNRIIQVDLTGTFLTLKHAIPHLQTNQGGSIVIMGSDQTLIGKGNSCAYGVTKGALGQLTKSTAIDFASDNIRVNCVCPGTIDTPLARRAMQMFADHDFGGDLDQGIAFLQKAQPIQRLGKSEEVGALVCFLLSDAAPFMTGGLISIDGGYTAM